MSFHYIVERHFRGYIDPALNTRPTNTPTSPTGRRLSVVLGHSDDGSEGGDDEGEEWQWNCLHPADPSDPANPLPPLSEGACKRKMHVPILIVATKVSCRNATLQITKKIINPADFQT